MIEKYNIFINKLNEDNIIGLYYINDIIEKVFSDTKVSSVNTTYEKEKDDMKLVITINNLFYDKTNILHTKFIFYTDDKKRKLKYNYFYYQYDINCNFKKIKFDNIDELENKIKDILDNKKFGKDLTDLSNLSVTLTTQVNKLLKENEINSLSIYNISYNPIVDQAPCKSLTFHFDINIEDTRTIKMIFKKIENNEYKITFNENEWFDEEIIDDVKIIPQIIINMIKKHII